MTDTNLHWDTTPAEIHQPLMIEIFGGTFTGKSHLAFSLDRHPSALFHYSERLRGVIENFSDKDIRAHDFGRGLTGKTREEISDSAARCMDELTNRWDSACSWARTFYVDNHPGLWELARFKWFGGEKPETFKGMERREVLWASINGEWRRLFRTARAAGIDIVLIGGVKDEWRNDKPTGKVLSTGQKDIKGWCDVQLHTELIEEGDTKMFRTTVVKPGFNYRLKGAQFNNLTLPQILQVLYGDSLPKGRANV
jgi:hypothetical protein